MIDWHNIEHNRAWLEASEHSIIGRAKSINLENLEHNLLVPNCYLDGGKKKLLICGFYMPYKETYC